MLIHLSPLDLELELEHSEKDPIVNEDKEDGEYLETAQKRHKIEKKQE
jgi:hypothetical protein